MAWRTPTGPLAHEHRTIDRLVALLERQLSSIRERGEADTAFVDAAVDFVREYAEVCHHGKEERILFRALAEKDMPPPLAETMGQLIEEHARSRELNARMDEANRAYASGDAAALSGIESAISQLVTLYPMHIDKEEHHFFKECLAYLSAEEQQEMLRAYEAFDASLIHEEYRSVVEGWEQRMP